MNTFCENCKHPIKSIDDSFRIEVHYDLLHEAHYTLIITYKSVCPFCGDFIYGAKRKELSLEDVLKIFKR